jgi:hypothetical protein
MGLEIKPAGSEDMAEEMSQIDWKTRESMNKSATGEGMDEEVSSKLIEKQRNEGRSGL